MCPKRSADNVTRSYFRHHRTGTLVDAGNFRGSRCVAKNKMLKMCIFAKDGDVNNSSFAQVIHRNNDILWTIKDIVEILSY